VVFINEFLQGADSKRTASELVDFGAFFFIAFFLRFQTFLVGDEFFLHEKPIFDAFEFELAKFAAGGRGDGGEFGAEGGITTASLFLPYTGRRGRRLKFLLLFLQKLKYRPFRVSLKG
jgi:hypothetical protein